MLTPEQRKEAYDLWNALHNASSGTDLYSARVAYAKASPAVQAAIVEAYADLHRAEITLLRFENPFS